MRHDEQVTTAMVMADGVATRYARRGAGPTVLLLGAGDALGAALARSFRVIAPEVPPAPSAGWLTGLLEGLGITAAALVATPGLAEQVVHCARHDPDRVRGVIILAPAQPAAADQAALAAALGRLFG